MGIGRKNRQTNRRSAPWRKLARLNVAKIVLRKRDYLALSRRSVSMVECGRDSFEETWACSPNLAAAVTLRKQSAVLYPATIGLEHTKAILLKPPKFARFPSLSFLVNRPGEIIDIIFEQPFPSSPEVNRTCHFFHLRLFGGGCSLAKQGHSVWWRSLWRLASWALRSSV